MSPDDVKPEPITEKVKSIPDVFKWLGDHRDGFLVSGAVLYGLGYLVWSFNAWENGLGQLPALEFQYLVAGIMPALIILVAWAGIALFYRLRENLLSLFKRHRRLYWLIVSLVVLSTLVAQLLPIAVKRKWLALAIDPGELATYTVPLILISTYLQIVAQGARLEDFKPAFRDDFMRYLLAAMFIFYGLFAFLKLYPNLPQELGGPGPRYAYIDLDSQLISTITQAVMAPEGKLQALIVPGQSKVIRSRKLQVFFSNSDYLLVRLESGPNISDIKSAPLYELKTEIIRAITWCK